MRAKVRQIYSIDVDLDTFAPEDPEVVDVFVRMIAGPANGPGEESFDLDVCTPKWLQERVRSHGPVVGRHYLIVDRFDARLVKDHLTRIVEALEAPAWAELGEKIGRIGRWEFEDYRPA